MIVFARMRRFALPFAVLLALAACDKGEPAPKATPTKSVEAPKPVVEAPKPPPEKPVIAAPTGLLGCKTPAAAAAPAPEGALPFKLEACPTIPSVFGTLAWGMDVAAAGKAGIKGAKIEEGGPYGSSGRFKIGKQYFHFGFSDAGKLDNLSFKTSPAGLAAMTAAWGAPLEVEFLGDKDKVWLNPAAKIKVVLEENTMADAGDDSEKYSVRYYLYTPLADLFGPEGLISKPIIGATGEELAKNYPEWLEVKTAEQAKADVAAMGLDAKTAGIAKWAGADEASAKLKLPQPETDNNLTFSLEWADKKVKSYGNSVEYGKDQALRTEIPAVIAAALGAPTDGTKDDKGQWTYNFAGPGGTKIELRDTGDRWRFEVTK